ncbi:MAG TPA: hypothetical protein VGD02_09600 [Gemmatimonadaceae bacterium]
MIKQLSLVCGAACVVAIAACSDSTGLAGGLSQADANQLAADMDAVASLGTLEFGLGPTFSVGVSGSGAQTSIASAPVPINNQFTATKQCPQGGSVALAGGVVGTGDRTTHSLTLDANATRTDANCAFNTRDGVLTVNGNPNLSYTGHLNIVNGVLSGLQTQKHKGSFTWSRTGGSGTCDVDITSSYDPAAKTATVSGSFCGHIVNVTRTKP